MCFNRKKSLNSQTNSGRHAKSSYKTLNEIISLLLTELRPRNAQGPATSDILCRLRASSDEVGRNVTMLPCWCCPKWNKVETIKTNIYHKQWQMFSPGLLRSVRWSCWSGDTFWPSIQVHRRPSGSISFAIATRRPCFRSSYSWA